MTTVALCAFALGAVFGFLAAVLDLHGWLLHAMARILRAQWFTPAQRCPRCGREVHLLRYHPERAGAWGEADFGYRCLTCSTPHAAPESPLPGRRAPLRELMGAEVPSAAQDAPDRTESAGQVLPGIPGWPGAPAGGSGPHRQDRTDEKESR